MPAGKVDPDYIKSLGFSAVSGKHLFNILKQLGFVDEKDEPSSVWLAYAADESRGLILAEAIKKAYADLFAVTLCPYLEGDESLVDFFKIHVKASSRDIELMLETFRNLSEQADFQDILCTDGAPEPATPVSREASLPEVKVNPNLQLNIQVHIAPDTPEEKIEAIFKNMRKYLLGKEDQE
jgi:hypothetical protein